MIEGKWYRCIEDSEYTTKGRFYKLLKNDGTRIFEYEIPERGSRWVHNGCFDPTPHIKTKDGHFVPEKENTMIEGKWYKCIESGSGVEAGKYYQCVNSRLGDRLAHMEPGTVGLVLKTRFDPTPHDRTVFPNAPDLLERVRRIDPAAAEWLEFGDHPKVCNFDAGRCNLDDMMVWSRTPHGHNYWERIHDAIDYEKEEQLVTKDDFKKGDRVEVRDDEDEDWEPATFLCMDDGPDVELKYVVRNMHDYPDGFKFCRRPAAPKRPHIEPGTPIEVWDDERRAEPEIERFRGWTPVGLWPYVVEADRANWKHCRVLVPNGVEV